MNGTQGREEVHGCSRKPNRRGPEWEGKKWDAAAAVRMCRYVSFLRSRHAQTCAELCAAQCWCLCALGRSMSLAHCQSVRHRNTIPNFILYSCDTVNRYRTILKPLSNGSSIVEQDALAVTQMMLCMATGIFRRRFCSYLFSFLACCLSASVGRGFSESRWRRWPWVVEATWSNNNNNNNYVIPQQQGTAFRTVL